ncbi:error-prone DNA polymerase [Paracraurococcus lichenis]|uniref:Error-prone DNA polymerase n=1 Tax=Paracraurococcus lichenis TaxID=3064888 RepID=A0ABT9DU25_9PROT|nr:error-prone DNA polymerase [Paracraurococcus sp. LOR1-02]MDO9707401.1 error-prone DNA polymerase [Paracraurococcus sp. LOR1-02]
MTEFAELAALSNFTFLDGASHPQELAAQARALGHAAIGIADRNSFAGLVRGWVAARKEGIPFVPGARVTLTDGHEYLAWPTDRAAYGRLSHLLSEGRMHAPKGECHVTREALIEAAEGMVLALVPSDAPDEDLARRLRRDAAALRRRLALPLFCAARHRFRGDDRKRLDRLAALGAPLLAAGGTRYHVPERRRLADVLAAIRLGTTVDALGYAAEANAEAHLKPAREMLRLFAGHEEAVAATLRVVAACRFSLDELAYEYPDEILDPGLTPQQTLEGRVWAAAEARWPEGVPEKVSAQLRYELRLIGEMDYAPYFLTVHEIVRYAEDEGILCQGRGSAANSAVCYVLRITSVDPDKNDLLFERFISASRNEPPDIDVDFEHERREEVIQHIYRRYGRDRAAIAATVIRYRDRSAIREVGKAMGLSEDVTGRLAKSVWGAGKASIAEIAQDQGLDPEGDPRLRMVCELTEELLDFPRHLATHVGGFVITRGRLTELAIVTKAAMADRHTIEWDKDDIEALRILKVDVLGLGMLSCIRRAFALIAQHGEPPLTLQAVPQDCPETYAMLRRADSLGVFQVESRAQMNMLPRLRPQEFYDLVIEVAIVRPGPIQGDMVHPYLRRKNKEEPVSYPSPLLEPVLRKTLGVPLFQEQAMQIAITGAGFTPARADELRRAMATFRHVGTIWQFQQEFIDGMVRNGVRREFAERCFRQIEGFGTYGFPESHAAAFAQLVYVSAWIKRWHPAAFACALLNSQPMGFYAPAQIVRDAREHGVAIRAVDVLHSDWDCTLEPEAGSTGGLALRLGLRLVQGMGEEAAKRIAAARPARSLADLVRRAALDRGTVERLAEADAFRALGLDRRAALWEAAAVEKPAPLQGDLFEAQPRLPEATTGEQTVLDYTSTGLSLRRHPLALLRPILEAERLADTRALNAARRGAWIRLPGLVLVRQRPGSAKGVVFFTVEDEWGVANLVVYPDLAREFRAAVVAARLVVAEGRVERHEAAVPIIHLIVRRLIDRSELLAGLAALDDPGKAPWRRALARADEVEKPDLRGDPRMKLPPSRDFH